jgi:hypothetical protein
MALTAGSAIAVLKPSYSPSRTLKESAFTGGEFSVMTPISPSREKSVTWLMAVMTCSLNYGFWLLERQKIRPCRKSRVVFTVRRSSTPFDPPGGLAYK